MAARRKREQEQFRVPPTVMERSSKPTPVPDGLSHVYGGPVGRRAAAQFVQMREFVQRGAGPEEWLDLLDSDQGMIKTWKELKTLLEGEFEATGWNVATTARSDQKSVDAAITILERARDELYGQIAGFTRSQIIVEGGMESKEFATASEIEKLFLSAFKPK